CGCLSTNLTIFSMSVLDPAHGEAGVYCVPVLLMHVQKLVREDVDQRLSTVAQHQLPTLVLSVRVQPHALGKLSLVDACETLPECAPALRFPASPSPRLAGTTHVFELPIDTYKRREL